LDPLKFFATADNVTAVLVAATIIAASVRAVAVRTVLRRRAIRIGLNSLGPSVNAEYVRGLFGAPVYGSIDSTGAGTLIWDVQAGYLAILFDGSSARVLEFTVTDHRFHFDVQTFTQNGAKGRLGRSTYVQMMDAESGIFKLGARRMSYIEQSYLGNPGGYCTVYLGYSDAGSDSMNLPQSHPAAGEIIWSSNTQSLEPEFIEELRRSSAPNTVAISLDVDSARSLPLADLDVVRLRMTHRSRTVRSASRSLSRGRSVRSRSAVPVV
jgi:hypothetical protein